MKEPYGSQDRYIHVPEKLGLKEEEEDDQFSDRTFTVHLQYSKHIFGWSMVRKDA